MPEHRLRQSIRKSRPIIQEPTCHRDLLKAGTIFPILPLKNPVLPVIKPNKNEWYLTVDYHILNTMVSSIKAPLTHYY